MDMRMPATDEKKVLFYYPTLLHRRHYARAPPRRRDPMAAAVEPDWLIGQRRNDEMPTSATGAEQTHAQTLTDLGVELWKLGLAACLVASAAGENRSGAIMGIWRTYRRCLHNARRISSRAKAAALIPDHTL